MRRWRIRLLTIALLSFGLLAVMALHAQETPIDPILTPEVVQTSELIRTDEVFLVTQDVQPTLQITSEVTEIAPTQSEAPTPSSANTDIAQEYIVIRGDTLRIIAERYQTTIEALVQENGIVNPDIIYIGQTLRIPSGTVANDPRQEAVSPTATLVITPNVSSSQATAPNSNYIIREGDTLAKIAVQFNTTVEALRRLNNVENPNLIYSGQTLTVSGETPADEISANEGAASDTAENTRPETTTSVISAAFDYGIYLDAHGQDAAQVIAQTQQLGVRWVRIDVKWRDIEATQGQIDFTMLDPLVAGFDQTGFNLLLTVSAAPGWARTSQSEDGPPDDSAAFAALMTALSTHYQGVVDAYQIWNEPNLRREWNSTRYPISAQFYVDLLRPAYDAVKAVDPDTLIVTAGLAPTGFNDGVNAINDRFYLQALYESGVTTASDAMGASISGWANPPDATCCTASEGVPTHFEDRSFYFKDTLLDYQTIMRDYNDTRPLWVTKFGWGSSEGITSPTENGIYFGYTDHTEQAAYVVRAFEIGAEIGGIGPMFLNNLDGCTGNNVWQERCYYSLTTADGATRPVFDAVAAMDKSNTASGE